MGIWYSLASFLGGALVKVRPKLSGKAGQIQAGQVGIWGKVEAFKKQHPVHPFWYHCASLGEFEQAKPVLLALREKHPGVPVVVTFFSPSGYEARKNFAHAEFISYLPLDTPGAAQKWVQTLNPQAVFWVKYEFWLGYLQAVKKAGIPLYLLAALPKEKYFTGLTTGYYKEVFACFNALFLQYPELKAVLPKALQAKAIVTGDPRFDNVLAGVAAAQPVDQLQAFASTSSKPILMVGSAWSSDMDMLLPALQKAGNPFRLIVFPHEMHPSFLSYLKEKCPGKVTFWSKEIDYRADTLVVDKVGFLSRAYAYADVAWVGGGFDKGLHNILEAAAWGKPVLHGPKTAHFPEAVRIDTAGGGFSITTESDAVTALTHLQQPENLQIASQAARQFVEAQAGATARILAEVEKTA